jgi:aminoglycoside 6'-N-acetyltransferase I
MKLWPEYSASELAEEQREILRHPRSNFVCLAWARDHGVAGFAEFAIREWAEGCSCRQVGYIEGWYVEPEYRRSGVGAMLVAAGEAWAMERGCQDMASDVDLDNTISQGAHEHLGYKEVGRSVLYAKRLRRTRFSSEA